MKADKTFSGVTPDHGTILRVNERVTSDSTAAIRESLAIYDSYYMGGHLRPVRRAVFVDRPMFGMSMMANNVPLLEIALDTALKAFKPYEEMMAFEELLSTMGGTSRAPSITIQPATTVLANGYKFADTLVESQNAWYDNRANWISPSGMREAQVRVVDVEYSVRGANHVQTAAALPIISPYVSFTKIVSHGLPTFPVADPYRYRFGTTHKPMYTCLLPIEGQGPAPFLVTIAAGQQDVFPRVKDMMKGASPKVLFNEKGERIPGALEFDHVFPLRWGIFYQEQDVELTSPIKKLAMIAYLNHLFDYLDGVKPGIGQYTWPDPDGKRSEPYTPKSNGHTGHHVLNWVLMEVARAAALRLEYRTAEELPSSTELQVIRAVSNLLYFLDHRDLLIKALCNTSDVRQFITMLFESELIHAGVVAKFVDPETGEISPDATLADLQAGIFPKEAAHFFWTKIIPLLPQDIFDNQLLQELAAGVPVSLAKPADEYEKWIKQGLISNQTNDPAAAMRWLGQLGVAGLNAVKHLNLDMRADYLAGAILARLRESLPLACALLRGEVEGYEHLHTNERILSFEVAANILDSINAMVARDMVSDPSVLSWEEPYTGARYSTQWQAYSVRFPVYPIQYIIHDAAKDCLDELKLIQGDHAGAAELLSTVETAFKTLGVTLIQCEPVMSLVNLNTDEGSRLRRDSTLLYMAGERQLNGSRGASSTAPELYGDINVSHGALRVTSTYYVRSATIWNQLLEMPHQVTARGNNPQPVPLNWHAYAVMSVAAPVAQSILRKANSALAEVVASQILSAKAGAYSFDHVIDLNPAFRDIAIVCPYVQMLVQTPPEAFAFSMMSKVSFDSDQRICNIAGNPIVLDKFVPAAGVTADQVWKLPNLATQMAYTAQPVTHMILPLLWNAVR